MGGKTKNDMTTKPIRNAHLYSPRNSKTMYMKS